MENKIQELTDKIYQEGVVKGNAEAERILAEAKAKAQQIVDEAQKEGANIVADAQKKGAELKQNTQAELKLFAGQCLEALKTEIANLITDKLAQGAVAEATQGKEFMQQVILTIVTQWAASEQLTIGSADAEALTKYFAKNAKNLLDKKVKVEQVNGLDAAFVIAPADGSYKVTFGEEEFVNYFKEFLRPELIKMLF